MSWFWFLNNLRLLLTSLLISFFGYFLPSLCSAKAVLSQQDDDLKEWLTYWTVFSLFLIFESIFDFFYSKILFYSEIKLLFICWLTLPRTQGAYYLYQAFLRLYFEKYENDIDQQITNVSNDITKWSLKYLQKVLWNIVIGTDTSALLGPVQSILGVQLIQQTLNLPTGPIESELPQSQSQVNQMLHDLKHSSLILSLSHNNIAFSHCDCRLHGRFYLEITVSDDKFIHTEAHREQRHQILSQISRQIISPEETGTRSKSVRYIISFLDIQTIHGIEDEFFDEFDSRSSLASLPDERESESTTERTSISIPKQTINVIFLTKEGNEISLYFKHAPRDRTPSWSLSSITSSLSSPALSSVSSSMDMENNLAVESLKNLTSCFQILSSRARGLVWKKLHVISTTQQLMMKRRQMSNALYKLSQNKQKIQFSLVASQDGDEKEEK